MGPQTRHGSKVGILDHGLSVTSKDPSKGGVLDHGQFETSSNPSKGGLLDVGRFKIVSPCTRGGVLQSDLGITFTRKRLQASNKGDSASSGAPTSPPHLDFIRSAPP